jgi:hypothetical protein
MLPEMDEPNDRAALPCDGPVPERITAVSAASCALAGIAYPIETSAEKMGKDALNHMGSPSKAKIEGCITGQGLARPIVEPCDRPHGCVFAPAA